MTYKTDSEAILRERKRENLLTLLNDTQRKNKHLTKENLESLAQSIGLPLSEVYSVSSFYSFLTPVPTGQHVIRICRSLPCYMKHSQMIVEAIENQLGISPGQTSPDGLFFLELVNCIGACDVAPAMLINDDLHGHLTTESIGQILASYQS